MMRAIVCLVGVLLLQGSVVYGTESLPLTRTESVTSNLSPEAAATNAIALALGRATNRQPSDAPAGPLKGKIRLPPTIINIEDLSEMRLERDATLKLLLPDIERARLRLDEPGQDLELTGETNQQGRFSNPSGGRDGSKESRNKHILSTFEIMYGFYNTLDAMVSTGMELQDLAWQIRYARHRDEGFEIDGKRRANSLKGRDSLAFDFSWNKNVFDLVTGVVVSGEMTGLQGNTNYSQLRNIGLDLHLQAGYILSSVSRVRVNFLLGHGTHVLDHPLSRQELENYSADATATLAMQWPGRLSLSLDSGIIFEESTASEPGLRENSVTAFSGGARFGFSLGNISFSLAGRVLAGTETWLAPALDVNWHLSPQLVFFGDLGREVFFLRFRQSVLGQAFVSAELPSLPVDRKRMAAGVRWLPSNNFSLVGTLVHAAYNRYPGLEENGRGLYAYTFTSPSVTSISAETRFASGEWLSLKAGWQQHLMSEAVPWLPDWELDATIEFVIPESKTSLETALAIKGDRNLAGLGAYTLLNLRLLQPLGSTSSIVVEARNLLGTRWKMRPLYDEPGLTLHAGFSARF